MLRPRLLKLDNLRWWLAATCVGKWSRPVSVFVEALRECTVGRSVLVPFPTAMDVTKVWLPEVAVSAGLEGGDINAGTEPVSSRVGGRFSGGYMAWWFGD